MRPVVLCTPLHPFQADAEVFVAALLHYACLRAHCSVAALVLAGGRCHLLYLPLLVSATRPAGPLLFRRSILAGARLAHRVKINAARPMAPASLRPC
jgi:hypothetical protein